MQAVTITQITYTELEALIESSIKKILSEEIKPEVQEELLTRNQAREFLQISLPNLDELTRKGAIRAGKIGSRVRYKKSDIINCLVKIEPEKL